MSSLAAIRDTIREGLTATFVVTALVLAAGLNVALGFSLAQVAVALTATAVVRLGDAVGDTYDVREAVTQGWKGALAFVGTAFVYALGEAPPWFLLLFGSVGAWFLADAVQTARHKGDRKSVV